LRANELKEINECQDIQEEEIESIGAVIRGE